MKKILCLFLILLLTITSSAIVGADSSTLAPQVDYASQLIFGDGDNDGDVDAADMLLLRKYIADNSFSNADVLNLDTNADGKVNGMDTLKIQKHLTNKEILTSENVYSIKSLEKCMYLTGRSVMKGKSLLMSQTASGMRFCADTTGEMELYLKTDKNGYLDIVVDEDFTSYKRIQVKPSSAKYKVDFNLPKGVHSFRFFKATEHTHNFLYTLNGLKIDGTLCEEKPQERPYRLEFYGDSMTSGYGNLGILAGAGGDWNNQDGLGTYATYLANALDAEWAVASSSGHGILGGHSDFTSHYKKFFDYSIVTSNTANNIAFSRTEYDADAIILNYGQNDYERSKGSLGCDLPAYKAECKKIIEQFHADNPDAKIVWVLNMMYIAENSGVHKMIEEACADYDYVTFVRMPTSRQNGADWHPSVEDHRQLAQDLLNILLPQGSATIF